MGHSEGGRSIGRPDYAEAAKLFHQAAAANLALGDFGLGVLYQNGAGVPKDTTEAIRRFKMAGEPEGLYQIALAYELGLGVEQNRQEAIQYYRSSAEKGHQPAKQVLKLLEADIPRGGPVFSELNSLKPTNASSLWVTSSDYPFWALTNRIGGTTIFELSVAVDGSVSSCQVISSSGNTELDERACQLVRSRARFYPLSANNNRRLPIFYRQLLNWSHGK